MQDADPVINAAFPLSVPLNGGVTITLIGDLWDPDDVQVLLGTQPLSVLTVTSTEIRLIAPARLAAGALLLTDDVFVWKVLAKAKRVRAVYPLTVTSKGGKSSNVQLLTYVDPLVDPPLQFSVYQLTQEASHADCAVRGFHTASSCCQVLRCLLSSSPHAGAGFGLLPWPHLCGMHQRQGVLPLS